MARNREHRDNLAELDAELRDRLLRLDEPTDRSDWSAVVKRSRAARTSKYRSYAIVASGAAVLALAFTLSLGLLFQSAGQSGPGSSPLRLALHMNDGSGLILYSGATNARFFDNSDGRLTEPPSGRTTPSASETAAIVQSLSDGPFHVNAALLQAASPARHETSGPLPGDQTLVSFPVFTTAKLKTTAGSAVLTCLYDADQNAYCDGAVNLDQGEQLTASGTLNARTNDITLVVTSDYNHEILSAAPRAQSTNDLD